MYNSNCNAAKLKTYLITGEFKMSKKATVAEELVNNEVEELVNDEASNETEVASTGTKPVANKTVVQHVEMEDGKVVPFPGKRKLQIEAKVDVNGVLHVRCDFLNGRVLQTSVQGDMLIKLLEFGAGQKFRDLIAGEDDIDSCVLDVEEFIDMLGKGQWAAERQKGTGSSAPLHKAVMEVTGKSAEEVKVWLNSLSQKQKLDLRKDPQIKPIIDRIEAAKKSKQPASDTAALLAGLMGS